MKTRDLFCSGFLLALCTTKAFSQGCVPARFMTLGLGGEGITYLEGGEWQAALSYRYLYADQGWLGDRKWTEYETLVGNQITIHSFELQATYAFSRRFNATFTLPVIYAQNSNFAEHDGTRHTVAVWGPGDIRLVGNAWLFDPKEHPDGNISIGVGVKAPTGDEAATGTYYKPTGPEVRPVDIALQPGDGGCGIDLEFAAYQKVYHRLFGYLTGGYLINPREQNKAYTTGPVGGQVLNLSVPDQYQGRIGLSYGIWPAQGLSVSFGGRVDGIPAHDAIGGDEGFRRPGYSIYAEPGVSWDNGKNSLSVFTPILVDAARERNIYEERANRDGGGAFADWLLIARFARRF